MKSLFVLGLGLLSLNLFAAESVLKGHKLAGDCKSLIVEKKVLNGVPSIALTEDPAIAFKAHAPIGGNTVTKKCVISMDLVVPGKHKLGVYDPNTNHLHLGRFNGIQNLYDADSSFSYDISWDLDDALNIPFQTRSYFNQGPLFANYFGGDFQAVLPHQWTACSARPRLVNLKVVIKLTATSSRENTAELAFRNAHLRLTTKKCKIARPFPRPAVLVRYKNRFNKLKELVMSAEGDFSKFYDKGNSAAGTRVRKAMQELKNMAQDIRVEVQKIKNKL
jgi:hypothetical protein